MQKSKILIANWKMNGSRVKLDNWLSGVEEYKGSVQLALCPPSIYIERAVATQKGGIIIGGQNLHHKSSGAFTDNLSASMLKESGAEIVLIGHSEVRSSRNLSNHNVREAAELASSCGLIRVICIGEDFKTRQTGKWRDFLTKQLIESLPNNHENLLIAYEPIWSIGTGLVPSRDEITAAIQLIRQYSFVESILYGGSVSADNSASWAGIDELGGLLVGGASLVSASFLEIAKILQK